VVKPQGRQGEVAVEVLTDFPERFAERRRVFALDAQGARRELHLENFWPHKGRLVLKFAGVDSISEAETLVGAEVQIPGEERISLEAGAEYVSDLVGCAVVAGGREVGRVAEVQFGAGEAPLLVVRQGKQEHLIPLAAEYVTRIDTAGKRIEMELPEGMLELEAPLGEEEKERQRRGE
jgi:16S rRNA processing protein RimM